MRSAAVLIVLAAGCGGSKAEEAAPKTGAPAAVAGTDSIYTEVSLQLVHQFADGGEIEIARLDGTVAERAMQPIALEIVATPLAADEPSGGAGGTNIGGGLDVFGGGGGGGGAAKAEVPDGAVQLEARWRIGSEVKVVGAVSGSICPAANTCLQREVLRIVLTGPDGASRDVTRFLLDLPPGTPAPATYRRYAIAVLDREVGDGDVAAARQALQARVEAGKPAFEAAKAETAEDTARRDRLLAVDVAAESGHLIALHFAAASDAGTAAAAEQYGLTVDRPTPRVLITSLEASPDGANTAISIDLRIDEVETRGDANAAASFQLARGLAESRLEGMVLEKMLGTPAVTTSRLMEAATAAGIEVRVLFGAGVELPAGLPDGAANRIHGALAAGHEVIVPAAAVELDGKARWGWWDVDPETNRTIGVMEDGQRQGLTEFNAATEKLGMHPEVGFVLGGLIGSIYTAYAISGQMLLHGEITDEFLDGLLEQLTSVGCALCPHLSGDVGLKTTVLGDCYKAKIPKMSASAGTDFCKRYNDGFRCATQNMVAALMKGRVRGAALQGSAKLKIGCFEFGDTIDFQ
jgi:hypothetical protein